MDVALFITCLTDTFFPRVGEAVVRVLRHFGCRVHFPEGQTCCGQPAYNSGFRDDAATVAQRLLDVFAPYEYIVSPSSSCIVMVKHHFPELFADAPPLRAASEALAARTYDFVSFLRGPLAVDPAEHLRFRAPATFHFPCHARELQSAGDLARMLGADRDGALCRPPQRPDLCCGFGGMFSIDLPEISDAMLTDKLAELTTTGAKLVVCNEAACALQIAGGAHRRGIEMRLKHVAELMAESLGLMEPD